MKIRRYVANNAQEAMLKVKTDLGNEAVILNTRKVKKKGISGIFSKPMVEVLAAIDEYSSAKESSKPVKSFDGYSVEKADGTRFQEKINALENKMEKMELLLQKVYRKIEPIDNLYEVTETNSNLAGNLTGILQILYSKLIKNDVDTELAEQIINDIIGEVGKNPGVNDAVSALYNVISRITGNPQSLKLKNKGRPTVAIFVGSTGVGKTTTIAKIAAQYLLNDKKSIAFITADTYRIAAVEQLKTYAEILGIPVSVIYSPNEMEDAINGYSDKDLVLIDTAGRSHRNKQQMKELETLIEVSKADEVYLVISAATSRKNCVDILNNYSFLNDYKLIFTKFDEAPSAGIILNASKMSGKSLSYITTGQNVPDDIELMNIEKIAKSILGSIN
ncbi:MAG TPA: flagellar biosynthesis protein FlhF [Clostridiaceae bacterium]|nr:flagellar biosynthesis protein FlhF [Clostridiaceae bacterium]HHV99058.1 flagellar biosynthesis protein FlhF [Clostridiaceae bacterium]